MNSVLRDILRESRSAITKRWLADTLASYPSEATEFLHHNKNPFANPVGDALTRGITGVCECLIGEKAPDNIRGHLEKIIKIRAVQDFSPSQAISFVFLLKNVIRHELGEKIDNPDLAAGVAEFDSRIDEIALLAFDIYVEYREQIYNLRVNEVKRSVSGIMTRFNKCGIVPDLVTGPLCDGNES
jgi:hypothetical protein